MGKITKFGHKNKGFSLIEAVMSVVLIMIFLFGVYKFFNVQNKNINSLMVENNSVSLIEDASLFLADVDYSELLEGYYGFYYNETNLYDAEYKLVPITETDASYEEGKYLDEKGHLIDFDPQYPEGVYKMLIRVYPESQSFNGQNFKNISIKMWYNGCDFKSPNACITKDFVKVGGNTDNLIWKNGFNTDIDSMILSEGNPYGANNGSTSNSGTTGTVTSSGCIFGVATFGGGCSF